MGSCCIMRPNIKAGVYSPPMEVLQLLYTLGGGGIPPSLDPPPPTKVTVVGKNEIYNRQNLVGPFLVHKFLGPDPPPIPLF